ncbi:hypothetical protein D1609_07140 [Leptospira borgpetersenii serovar Hardjo-bovis]|nr:hypothetical protein D1609_07140 [Leptospira borgpetersenii serovar Hardjo-bovis]
MGDLKNMRKKIYCSGWGAISELVPKLSSVGAVLPRLCPQSSECGSSHILEVLRPTLSST